MKKTIFYIIILLLIFPTFVNAKTLGDLKNELSELKTKKSNNELNTEKVKKEIANANAKINEITVSIANNLKEQDAKQKEIEKLEIEIDTKNEQIKSLIVFYQTSKAENFYLKYLFSAESFTDFIYRFSSINQITEKNNSLIEEMNDLIDANNKKLKELENKKKELELLNEQVKIQISKLGSEQSKYLDESIDIDSEIKTVSTKIEKYTELGCTDNEDLTSCTNGQIPNDNGFIRPTKSGYINDEFGMRWHPIYHKWTMHNGVDIAGNSAGTPVYAVAAGRVSDIMYKYYCGGNIITINHVINGVSYTTRYWHLLTLNVKEGDIVEQGDQIATVGGNAETQKYDTCTTGPHLHFELANGHYYGTGSTSYSSWSTYITKVINARSMITFPAGSTRWYS